MVQFAPKLLPLFGQVQRNLEFRKKWVGVKQSFIASSKMIAVVVIPAQHIDKS
jgi:hypothetical protein